MTLVHVHNTVARPNLAGVLAPLDGVSADILVPDGSAGVPADHVDLFTNATGATPLANPVVVTAGVYECWVESGDYDEVITGVRRRFAALTAGHIVRNDAAAEQTILSKLTVSAPTGIALNLDGNLDGQAGANPNPYRVGFGVGCVNGSNGTRGDAINLDTANGVGASFFAPYYQNVTGFATKGTITAFTSYMTINEVAGGGYGEAFPFYGGLTSNRKGALTSGIEVQNTINAGKPARASAANLIVIEANAPPTYTGFARTAENGYTTADFGASSQWLRGARVLDIVSGGAQPAGVGINFRGSFARPILFEPDTSNGFAVGSSGFVDICRSNGLATGLRMYDAAVSKQVERLLVRVDGKHFWGPGTGVVDTALERSQGGTLKVTSALGLTAIAAASVGNNTIFIDVADDVLKFKDSTGALVVL